ncbi:MAG: hypothetical protein IT434_05365 [Phycisphaerales bacterium]|jgi:hypothetical protein|nr:hypothetical protein [Phycisphaerales bacterium]
MNKIAILALLAATGVASAHETLVITYDGGFGGGVNNVYNAVLGADPMAEHLYNPAPGAVAAYLASEDVDNLFIFDITTSNMMSSADAAAVGAWYDSSKSAVIDGRSYGVYFNGGSGGDEDRYIQNTANWFMNNGGGMWIGTDHEPDWTVNGNQYLVAAGFTPIIGLENGPATGWNASPLWDGVVVSSLDWSGGSAWTVGHTPVGLQPNGVTLSNILYSGPGDPMISTYLVPAPGAAGALALVGLAALRRRR